MGRSGERRECGSLAISMSTPLIPAPQGTVNPALPRHLGGGSGVGICAQTRLLSDSALLVFHSFSLEVFTTRMDKPLGRGSGY